MACISTLMRDPGLLLKHPKLGVKGTVVGHVCEAWAAARVEPVARETAATSDLEAWGVRSIVARLFDKSLIDERWSAPLRCTARPRLDLWISARSPADFRMAYIGVMARSWCAVRHTLRGYEQ